jgi:exodeoxyribonuclease V alpha subunit
MHGEVEVYRGTAAAAGTTWTPTGSGPTTTPAPKAAGVARRFVTGPDGCVVELAALIGDGYEAWVAGLDPETVQPRGRLRADASAVRLVEIVVNGPKSGSLAFFADSEIDDEDGAGPV